MNCILPWGNCGWYRINCPKGFCEESIKSISDDTNLMFYKSKIIFLSCLHDRLAQVMSQIKIFAGALFKISNDIKILSSGPRSGIYELTIPQNELQVLLCRVS